MALAWALGYPIAFAILVYLIKVSVGLPLRAYVRGAWGIVGCCGAGLGAGFAVSAALAATADVPRMIAVSATSLGVTLALLVTWQKITPRSIAASLR